MVSDHLLAAAARGVRFQRVLRPVQVEGDADKLRVIVDNLLANALKYSPRDAVIKVLLGAETDNAVIDVIDEGPGVPAKGSVPASSNRSSAVPMPTEPRSKVADWDWRSPRNTSQRTTAGSN